MTNPESRDDALLEGLRACLEETLGRELESLEPSQRLVGDLGLDSLDMLDLVFRLERRFGARLNPKDFELKAKAALGGAPLIEDGFYTPLAAAEIKKAMPCVPPEEFASPLPAASLIELFRVQTLLRLVAEAKAGGGASAPEGPGGA